MTFKQPDPRVWPKLIPNPLELGLLALLALALTCVAAVSLWVIAP